jgi:hypothetical protein
MVDVTSDDEPGFIGRLATPGGGSTNALVKVGQLILA